MKLPTAQALGQALQVRRKRNGWSKARVAEEYKKLFPQRPFNPSTVGRWESGFKGSYEQLRNGVLPAYGIKDIDEFFDSCNAPTRSDVAFIDASKLSKRTLPYGAITVPEEDFSKGNRTRIDVLEINPGESTPFGKHAGHEHILVLEGEIICQFSEKKDDPEKLVYAVKEGGRIAFPSLLFHGVTNASKEKRAVLIVARPTYSLRHGPDASEKD